MERRNQPEKGTARRKRRSTHLQFPVEAEGQRTVKLQARDYIVQIARSLQSSEKNPYDLISD